MKQFMRSPYRTRSTSKSRAPVQSYISSHHVSSPTKALTFHEGDEESDEIEDAASPKRTNYHNQQTPKTPGQIEAHEDADVYMQDCCNTHDVRMPDGSIVYRRHSHGHSHRSIPRPSYSPVVVASDKPAKSSGLVWYVLLSLLMVSLLGPWALNQITHKPPSFIGQKGQEGAMMTQGEEREETGGGCIACLGRYERKCLTCSLLNFSFPADFDQIISHVLRTMRDDLQSHRFVDEPRLSSVTSSLSDRLSAERSAHVTSAVSAALKEVTTRLDEAMAEENKEDAATLAATRKEIIDIIQATTNQATSEWSATLIQRFSQEINHESSERQQSLKQLLGDLTALRESDLSSASSARSTLRADVLSEVHSLLALEQSEDLEVSAELERQIRALIQQQATDDAENLQVQIAKTRTEFEALLASRLEARLADFEKSLRQKVMDESAQTFAPISAVLNKASDADQLAEDLLLQKLKAHLNNLVSQIPVPREIDEAALEVRVVAKVDQTARVKALQDRIDSLSADVENAARVAKDAEQLARVRPTPVIQQPENTSAFMDELQAIVRDVEEIRRAPKPRDFSEQIAAIEEKITALKNKPEPVQIDHSAEIASLTAQISALENAPAPVDHSAQLAALEAQLIELQNAPAPVQIDHSDEIAALEAKIAELQATPAPIDYTEEIDQLKAKVLQLQSVPDHTAQLKAIEDKIFDLQSAPAPVDHSVDIASLRQQLLDLQSHPTITAEGQVDHSAAIADIRRQISAIQDEPKPEAPKDYTDEVEALQSQVESLRAELARVQAEEQAKIEELERKIIATTSHQSQSSEVSIDVNSIRREISLALERYSADRTQLVDYALRSSGGRILAHSASHQVRLEGNLLVGFIKKCFMSVRKADEVLNDNMSVGSCWPMAGQAGFVSIGLREQITPTSVSIQHIATTIAPDYTTTPKEFSIYVRNNNTQHTRMYCLVGS